MSTTNANKNGGRISFLSVKDGRELEGKMNRLWILRKKKRNIEVKAKKL
jgi:hypothetical protein